MAWDKKQRDEWLRRPGNRERALLAAKEWAKRNRAHVTQKYKKWLKSHPGKAAEFSRRYHEKHPEKAGEYRQQIRMIVLSQYSLGEPVCACCGETIFQFLALDHINGGGRQETLKLGNNQRVYARLIAEGFPVGYRVLCHNCNQSIGAYGGCPHEQLDD